MDPIAVYPRGVDEARLIQVIETKAARGAGTDEQPVRIVRQYWTPEGEFLAEFDPCAIVILEDA